MNPKDPQSTDVRRQGSSAADSNQANLTAALVKQDAMLRSLQVGVLLAIDRKVIWANQRFFAILGFAAEELTGQDTRIYFNSKEDYLSIQERGYPLLAEGKVFATELRLRRKDGSDVWCHITGNAVNMHDLSEGSIWSFADISDLVKAKNEMREARESLADALAKQEAMLRSLQVGVLLAKDRKVVWANQRFFDMLGFTSEELTGQSTRLYFSSEEDYVSIQEQGYPLLREGKVFFLELCLRRKDGTPLWCHITGNAVNLNNLSEGFIWSFADISDRVLAEQRAHELMEREKLMEAEKMTALGLVVAGVAHEINTPIGVSYTLMTHFERKTQEIADLFAGRKMKQSDLENYIELSKETASQLNANISRAADLIRSFKKIAVDQSRDDQRVFNLKEYLFEIVNSLKPTLRKTSHRMEIDCADDITVNNYPGALSQVITNLIMNALIHAFDVNQSGAMTISVVCKDGQAFVNFKDDGKGIPADNLPRIFDPFFTTKRGAGGSGLGLSIVFNLVTNKLQGHISCESVVGQGTTFKFNMPLVAGPTPEN
jgi:PAS domain S-box-containing protein